MGMTDMTRTRTRTILGLGTAAVLLALSACGGGDGDSADAGSAKEPTSQESSPDASQDASEDAGASPEADLEGIPDVVAEVNGEELTKEEFAPFYQAQLQQAAGQAQASGQEPDREALKEETANNLVDTELLVQEAESRGISVSDEQVDAELTSLAKGYQLGSAEELITALEKQGTTEEQARSQVGTQLAVELLVDDESGPVAPSEKELRALYARVKEQAGQQGGGKQQVPPYAQVKSQLEEQATAERVGEVAQKLVDDLRKDADITINLG
jgi:peptidyl-prolyl cis-trans isomerase SurA